MSELNAEQLEAVETVEGTVLVLAGAGSGKTRVITHRILHLIEGGFARPEQILAVTFTNKAAGEMKSRVLQALAPEPRTGALLISTFHSLCVRILRRFINRLDAGYTRDFTIYDEDDQMRVVRAILKEQGVDDKTLTPRSVISAISHAKNVRMGPESYSNQAEYQNERAQRLAVIYGLYEKRLAQANALDFDDLLIKTVDLLRRVPEVREYYHQRYRHLMIDEFQDTNGIQYELARLIATGLTDQELPTLDPKLLWRARSLCVVGDIDQSIYSWRGSDFNIILNFRHDFQGTRIIKLERNYRSTATILEAANRVIENNRQRLPRTLYATEALGRGELIRYYQAFDGEGEAAFVADEIDRYLKRASTSRVAVLYRANSQSRLFEEALRRRAIAYNIVGGFSFYERAEIKDIIAYLKLALNPADDVALARVINSPPRGIGKVTLDALDQLQQQLGASMWETLDAATDQRTLSPRANGAIQSFRHIIDSLRERVAAQLELSEIVKAATIDTGYLKWLEEEKSEEAESRLLNIEELVTAAVEAEEQGESLRDFIDHAALVSDTDQYKADARVTLMTMHSAKGLEFPVVFIAGLEEGLFPHSRAAASESDLEEERRLCYVAITRTQQQLYITHAMQRRSFGEEMITEPSRFLNEIPLHLIENLSRVPSWLGFAAKPETRHNREAISALRGEAVRPVKNTSNYSGKTYNSAESVREFFNRRTRTGAANTEPRTRPGAERGSGRDGGSDDDRKSRQQGDLRVGSRIRHARYGRGVVLRMEGSGDDAKLTVDFPGFGHKKFIAKYATFEDA